MLIAGPAEAHGPPKFHGPRGHCIPLPPLLGGPAYIMADVR